MDIPRPTPEEPADERSFEERVATSPIHRWLESTGTTVDDHLDRASVPRRDDLRDPFHELLFRRGAYGVDISDDDATTFTAMATDYLLGQGLGPDQYGPLYFVFLDLVTQWKHHERRQRRRNAPNN